MTMPKVEDGKLSDFRPQEDNANANHILIVSLRQWCKENGVKIRLTHKNHIVIQERKKWDPSGPPPEEKILVQNLVFIDRSTSILEEETNG